MQVGSYCFYKNAGHEGVVQVKAIAGPEGWPPGPFSAYELITVTPILDTTDNNRVEIPKATVVPAIGFDKLTELR
jgi:hypothetical protein